MTKKVTNNPGTGSCTWLLFLFFVLIPFLGLNQENNNYSARINNIDSIMRATLVHSGKNPVYNFLLYAKNKNDGSEVNKGVGVVGRNNNPIDENYQFRIASITKTFVATIVLQLVEEEKIKLKDKVHLHLNKIDFLNFSDFHIHKKKPYSEEITVQHLLSHTSGVADIFTDAETRFLLRVYLKKDRMYTEESIVELFFKYKLNKKALNKPGEGYHYSDMNFMLLGFLIEQITSKSLTQNIRERILEPLNMENTFFEYYEAPRGNKKMADAYLNRLNLTQKVNTSYEWAGGGLVSTAKELGVFIDALFSLKLFNKKETLLKMIDTSVTEKLGGRYGLGISKYEIYGNTFYGHGGYYGSLLLFNPEDKIIMSANIGQANANIDKYSLLNSIYIVLKNNPTGKNP